MQTIESIRKNIRSAEDLGDIVRTMRTLAAVNIHHFEQAVHSLEDYSRSIEMGFQVVLKDGAVTALASKEKKKRSNYYVVFGTEQGLCGGFNDQIAEYAFDEIRKDGRPDESDLLICTGQRVLAGLEDKKMTVAEVIPLPGALSGITLAVQQIVMHITDLQAKGRVNRVMLFHHRPASQSSFNPVTVRLLPIDRAWIETVRNKKWPTHVLPSFTMDRDALFSALFRQYIFVSLFRAFAESMASENAARLLSMQSAEKNIEERIEQLHAVYRSERQNSITSELLDIVSGFEALRDVDA